METRPSQSTTPRVSILVVNFNSGDRLYRCLQHLAAQSTNDFEVIVIDNASEDYSIDQARKADCPFELIASERNIGFAAANNLGATKARGEWIIFLNPDAYADRGWLAALVAAAETYPTADAFGSTQLNAQNPDLVDGAGDVLHASGFPYRGHFGWKAQSLPGEGACFSPCAAAAMYRRSTFDTLGGFDESFFCYGEDVDLGYRLRLSGGHAVHVDTAIVHHEGSGITGRHSDFTIYHGHRNRIWLFYKNTPALLLFLLAPINFAANIAAFFGAALKGYAGAYGRAMKDGYLGLGEIFKKRQHIQQARKASWREIASALTWSVGYLATRQADIRPISKEPSPDT